jgi:putative hemolysin
MTDKTPPQFRISIANSDESLKAAQRLRYDVFVRELGGGGPLVDHLQELEKDHLDPFVDHMLLHDDAIDAVVGVYRLMRPEMAQKVGQYYSQDEYDLLPLINSGRRLLELGRSCVHRDYRGGTAMFHLWNGLAQYVLDHNIDIMFGVASFHGTDTAGLAEPLSLLHHRHLAPQNLRVKARTVGRQPMNIIPEADLDRRKAMVKIPALIKAYLRLGGVVGEGAFVDHTFNTTDVCLILDTANMNTRQSRIYSKGVK